MRPRTWVLVLAAVFAVLQLANVTGRDTPDTKNYLSYALSLSGESKRAAATVTIDYYCASRGDVARRDQSVNALNFHGKDPAARVAKKCRAAQWRVVDAQVRAGNSGGFITPFMPERFMSIFEVRPGYPVFLVPFVTLLGPVWGLWTSSVVLTVAGGILVFLILRTLSVSVPLALTGQALYYVLPCGTTAMRPMTEGLMMALTLAAVWGCALVATGRRTRAALALVGGSLLLLFTVKHSQALFLGLCLAGAGALVAVRQRQQRRAWAVVAGLGAAAAVGTLVLAGLLHYPSQTDSLQDLLTDHYARPDRARLYPEFLHLEADFWLEWTRQQLWQPVLAAALGAGLWGASRRPVFGVFLIGAAFTGILTQAAHPDISVWGGRLIVLVWLLPVVGVPLLLESAVRGKAVVAVPAQAPGLGERAQPVR
ncbi:MULTISPECIES: hypothetical protein [unclassified Streptomyces]|uniref:hypothetical protein n=1 Tax=unclassified Streptomyces TaxID=2593676 RepID=UPI001909C41D|nr:MULTISPECIES: hypothetical protein [unclassified Streptomyces]MBK3568463.1 hypothetical protein [Streptomyces sp. MBT62]MBK6017228.1 hypothetical protein [Streptomyces sp. MBT53]